jgi:hypothetical protein
MVPVGHWMYVHCYSHYLASALRIRTLAFVNGLINRKVFSVVRCISGVEPSVAVKNLLLTRHIFEYPPAALVNILHTTACPSSV